MFVKDVEKGIADADADAGVEDKKSQTRCKAGTESHGFKRIAGLPRVTSRYGCER